MTISGIMPLRNAVKLGYPFALALQSLRRLCDELVVLIDPESEDGTLAAVRGLGLADRIVRSVWDMGNHAGHTNCEISVQTAKAAAAAEGDWIFSLQADEVLHEAETTGVRAAIASADLMGVSGLELGRLYFYGGLGQYRDDWTQWLLRLFKRGLWRPDVDGAMRFDPIFPGERSWKIPARIYHYSRVGDPQAISERVRNLDRFFHAPDRVAAGAIAPYDFTAMRKLDTYVTGHKHEPAQDARLLEFPMADHPAGVVEHFHGR